MKFRLKNKNFVGGKLAGSLGFEPVVSALRGQRPGPLDERAVEVYLNIFPSENGFFRERSCSVKKYSAKT